MLLTAREHFVAHRLLAKAHPGNNKLLFAVAAFRLRCDQRLLTSKQIAVAREANAAGTGKRNKLLASEGRHTWQTAEYREAQSLRLVQLAAEGRHPAQAAEAREALSQLNAQLAAEGRHPAQTAEFREAQSLRMAAKATCPYCGKVGGAAGMRRSHFENCKLLKEAKAND